MKTAIKIAVLVFKIAVFIVINLVIPFMFGVWGLCILLLAELFKAKRQNRRAVNRTTVNVTYKGKRLENRALCFANADKTQGYIRYGKKHIAVKHTRLGWQVK